MLLLHKLEVIIIDQLNLFLSNDFKKEKKQIECTVMTNEVANGNNLPFEVGKKVTAKWIDHIGLAEFIGPGGQKYKKRAIKRVTGKKINGKKIDNFVVHKRDKQLFCI